MTTSPRRLSRRLPVALAATLLTASTLSGCGLFGSPDLVIYNAGMDPHQDSAVGGLRGITTQRLADRERMVFPWARERGAPVAFVLAGGYVSARLPRERLADLHRLTIGAAAGATVGER